MATLTQNELLSGLLVICCIVLLYCVFSKKNKSEGLSRSVMYPELAFKEGMLYKRNTPLKHYPRGTVGYIRSGIEGLDAGPVAGMNELVAAGNLSTGNVVAGALSDPNAPSVVNPSWKQDMSIQIDNLQMTDADRDAGLQRYGNELIDTGLGTDCGEAPEDPSLSRLILTKTDYEPQYGWAKGSVTL